MPNRLGEELPGNCRQGVARRVVRVGVCQQQQYTREPLFAAVEQLVHEVNLNLVVPCQQV